MAWGSILLGLSILILVAAFVLRPVLQPASWGWSSDNRRLSELQAERDRIIDLLREVDLDHSTGKLLPQDYRAQREALALRGAAVLREIDLAGGLAQGPGHGRSAQRRADGPAKGSVDSAALEAELEAMVRQLRGQRSGSQAVNRFCSRCGAALQPGDRFCASCGAPVPAPA
jgi:hypothetical protein